MRKRREMLTCRPVSNVFVLGIQEKVQVGICYDCSAISYFVLFCFCFCFFFILLECSIPLLWIFINLFTLENEMHSFRPLLSSSFHFVRNSHSQWPLFSNLIPNDPHFLIHCPMHPHTLHFPNKIASFRYYVRAEIFFFADRRFVSIPSTGQCIGPVFSP